MVGSSIFGRWTNCINDLAPLPVLNRAFGGSVIGDQLFFFDQIVPSSRAALVVWYCGSNDVNSKQSPEDIVKEYREVDQAHARCAAASSHPAGFRDARPAET